jgi:hypothetical protein
MTSLTPDPVRVPAPHGLDAGTRLAEHARCIARDAEPAHDFFHVARA